MTPELEDQRYARLVTMSQKYQREHDEMMARGLFGLFAPNPIVVLIACVVFVAVVCLAVSTGP